MDEMVEFLQALFARTSELSAGVAGLVAYGRRMKPDAPWSLLESVDFVGDARSFSLWIDEAASKLQEPSEVQAAYFGLSEDATSVQLDWAALSGSSEIGSTVGGNYVQKSLTDWTISSVLHSFRSLSEEVDHGVPVLQYVLSVGYVGILAKEFAPRAMSKHCGKTFPAEVGFLEDDAFVVFTP